MVDMDIVVRYFNGSEYHLMRSIRTSSWYRVAVWRADCILPEDIVLPHIASPLMQQLLSKFVKDLI